MSKDTNGYENVRDYIASRNRWARMMGNDVVLSWPWPWSESAELDHVRQVRIFGWCLCEDYEDCEGSGEPAYEDCEGS